VITIHRQNLTNGNIYLFIKQMKRIDRMQLICGPEYVDAEVWVDPDPDEIRMTGFIF
jgi:hypothetical protein